MKKTIKLLAVTLSLTLVLGGTSLQIFAADSGAAADGGTGPSKLGDAVAVITAADTLEFGSLQEALDAAHEMTGDVTVTLVADPSGFSVVHQKEGLNLTIDGAEKTLAGQIIVDGDGRASGTETLTIRNIVFEGNSSDFCSGTDSFVLIPNTKDTGKPYTTGKSNSAHNVTVTGCSFKSTSESLNVVGLKVTSGASAYSIALNEVTGEDLHSLAQLTGTTGVTVTDCTLTKSKNGVNISGGAG
ncbi:MAG: hypothetical protein II173_06605, partial [Firmicutes bacterium]|nr:hypothetical protein [Bacillota bacterium]